MEHILTLHEKLLTDKVEKSTTDVYLMMMFCVHILQLFALHGHLFVLCHRTLHMFAYSCHPSSLSSILGHQRVDVKPQTETPPPGPLSWSKSVGSLKRTVFMNNKIHVICIIEIHYLYMFFVRFYVNSFCTSSFFVFQKSSSSNTEANKLYSELQNISMVSHQ